MEEGIPTFDDVYKVPAYVIYVTNLMGTFVSHPMDVMRVNVQANALHYMSLRKIIQIMVKKKGLTGFYYGIAGATSRCTAQTITHYMMYHHFKHSPYIMMFKPFDTYTIAGLSGLCAGLISTPLAKVAIIRQADLTRDTFMRRNYSNPMKGLICMYSKGGLAYIFAGYELHALSNCLVSMLHTPIYEAVQDLLVSLHRLPDRSWEISLISLTLTGSIMSFIFTPIDAVKTMVMNADYDDLHSNTRVCKSLYRVHGLKGFFLGLKPSLASILPHSIIATFTYFQISNYFAKV